MDDLPSEFDVIVVGTGLAESIVSAAASRVGHSVLHLDPRDYYGGKWTTLNWESLECGSFARDPEVIEEPSDFEWENSVSDVEPVWYVSREDEKKEISSLSRRFNIDVYPKVLLAREEMIQLLIDSNVSRYLEFKCIQKLYASLPPPDEHIVEPVPLSRSDIFTSKSLGLVEKRKLTKFIELILKPENSSGSSAEEAEARPESLEQLVGATKVTDKIQHLIRQAVKTVEDEFDPTKLAADFVERCRLFLQSIGRYGNQTPYLWTLYGVGEICQAFCRLSAIYGGIFILKRTVKNLRLEGDHIVVTSDGVDLKTKNLILGPELRYKQARRSQDKKVVVRGILLVKGGPLHSKSGDENPDTDPHMIVYKLGDMEVIELDHSSLAVPKPFRLIHVTGPGKPELSARSAVEAGLEPFLDFSGKYSEENTEVRLSQSETSPADAECNTDLNETKSEDPRKKPVVLFGSCFLIKFHATAEPIISGEGHGQSRVFDCSFPSTEITSEIERAREIFRSIYPEEEFLPKASDGSEVEEQVVDEFLNDFKTEECGEVNNSEPDPEDIIESEQGDDHGPPTNP